MVDSQLDLAHVASTQPDSFIAIKLTAFYPPKILWLSGSSCIDSARFFYCNQIDCFLSSEYIEELVTQIESCGGSISFQRLRTWYPIISISEADLPKEMNLEHLTYENIRYLFSITNPMNAVQLDQKCHLSMLLMWKCEKYAKKLQS
jgi:hypothetical protein